MNKQSQSPFFLLPSEIRVIIYELLFNKIVIKPTIEYLYDTQEQAPISPRNDCHNFLLTCRLCHEEGVKIYYQNTTFDWSEVRPCYLKCLDPPTPLCKRIKSISNLLLVRSDISTLGWTAVGLRTEPATLITKFPNLERLSFRFSEPLRWFCPKLDDFNKLTYKDFYEGLRASPIPALGEDAADEPLNTFLESQRQIEFTLYITWYLDYRTSFGTTKTEMQRNAMNTRLKAVETFSQAPVHPMYGELANDRDRFKKWEAFTKSRLS